MSTSTRTRLSWLDAIREELAEVKTHLQNPTTEGITACLPHLTNAVQLLQERIEEDRTQEDGTTAGAELPSLSEMEDLRRELALSSLLFENAYKLQAGWAAMQGFAFDGVPADALYGQSGQWVNTAQVIAEVCQG